MRHSECISMWEEAIVRSGEVKFPREGRRVGESRLRSMRLVFVRDSVMMVPLASALIMMLLSRKLKEGKSLAGRTGKNREDVNVMDVDGDITDDGCDGELLGGGVTGEEGVCGEVGEGDGVVNEVNKSSTTCITRRVLTDSNVVWKGAGWQVLG